MENKMKGMPVTKIIELVKDGNMDKIPVYNIHWLNNPPGKAFDITVGRNNVRFIRNGLDVPSDLTVHVIAHNVLDPYMQPMDIFSPIEPGSDVYLRTSLRVDKVELRCKMTSGLWNWVMKHTEAPSVPKSDIATDFEIKNEEYHIVFNNVILQSFIEDDGYATMEVIPDWTSVDYLNRNN